MRSIPAALLSLLIFPSWAGASAPDDAAISKALGGFEAASTALDRSTSTMLQAGPLCQATYAVFTYPGAITAERLRKPLPGTDGRPRDVRATIAFRRASIVGLGQALQKKMAAGAAKAEASGDGSALEKEAANLVKEIDGAIQAELSLMRSRIAEGDAERDGVFGRGALAAIREQTVDVNCQKLIQSIDASKGQNNALIARMEDVRRAAREYQKSLNKWTGDLKKPVPAAPVPQSQPNATTPPTATTPPPPKSQPTPTLKTPPVENTEAAALVTKPTPPPAVPSKPAIEPAPPATKPVNTLTPKRATLTTPPPRETVELVAPPEAPVIAAPEAAVVLTPQVKTEAPPPSITAYNLDEACVKQLLGNTVPFKHAEAILQFIRKTNGAAWEAKPSHGTKVAQPSKAKTDLRSRILAEGTSPSPTDTPKAAYDPARDRWTTNGPMAWKKYDREKRALGKRVAPPVSETEFAAAAKQLGGKLTSEESRVRLQMAINEAASAGKENGPTVFQDGLLGSRTRNAVVYYLKQHPEEFRRALERQGFRPKTP